MTVILLVNGDHESGKSTGKRRDIIIGSAVRVRRAAVERGNVAEDQDTPSLHEQLHVMSMVISQPEKLGSWKES